MRFAAPTLVLSALATLALAAPLPALPQPGDGLGALTAPLVDTLVGSNNVNSIDAIAGVLGVAQYPDGDNPEDRNALPQQTLDILIGEKGAVTGLVKELPVKRGALGDALAKELAEVNGDVDQTLAAVDQIANNLIGVCGENTTAPEALCGAVTTGKTSSN